ncbi:MAG: FtsX-like permease family protein [Bacteroidales bacterium]|nr:FtsX-like permease family protein [Bacteroidales bacterium]
MIKFILKGILRDKSRSLIPVIVVAAGVFLTVFLSGYFNGVFSDMIDLSARFTTGHVKIMTRAYAEDQDQLPLDLALLNVSPLMDSLNADYPEIKWVKRIHFGGLLDIPDSLGETRGQGPAMGTAVDMLSPDSDEIERLNIRKSIVRGSVPTKSGEALISEDFAVKFNISPGEEITLFGTTMNGSMMFQNFRVCGTLSFGSAILDRGALFIDIRDAQLALDMDDAATEILGYFPGNEYDDLKTSELESAFNASFSSADDDYSPEMFRLEEQNDMGRYLTMAENMSSVMVMIFVLAMSLVLWNTGLLGGLRRYSEYGIRLALGEEKKHIYKTMIYEAILIGIIGSVVGTIIGLGGVYWLQTVGLDVSGMMDSTGMMIPGIIRSKVTPDLFYLGFFPGVLATVLGNALAGFAIYKRKTSKLFKELEV